MVDHVNGVSQTIQVSSFPSLNEAWRMLRSTGSSIDEIVRAICALSAIHKGQDDPLAAFIVRRLGERDLPLDLREVLVGSLGGLTITDASVRAVAARHLYLQAVVYRDSTRPGSERETCSALSGFVNLATPRESLEVLNSFMRPSDQCLIRQCALQLVADVLRRHPELIGTVPLTLRRRVLALARRYIHPDIVISPEMNAVCIAAYVAATLLCRDETLNLTRLAADLRKPCIVESSIRWLKATLRSWDAQLERNSSDNVRLRYAIDLLEKSLLPR